MSFQDFEFSFGNKKYRIGVIGECLYDSLDEFAWVIMDNDLFVGSQIAFNDIQSTEILFGGIFDLSKSSKLFSLEASRRFGENWNASVELRLLSDIDETEFLHFFREDSFV